MDVSIMKEQNRPLLHRKDCTMRVAAAGATPSRKALVDLAAKHFKTDASHIVVRSVEAEFGSQSAIVTLSVYKDAASVQQFEPAYMKKRHGVVDGKTGGEA